MVHLAAVLGVALAAALIATAVTGQSARPDGRFQRPAAEILAVPKPVDAATPLDLEPILHRIEALENGLAALIDQLDSPDETQLEFARQLAAIEAGIDQLTVRDEPNSEAIVDELGDRVGRFAEQQAPLSNRVAALEAAFADATEPGLDLTPLVSELEAIHRAQTDLAADLAALSTLAPTITDALAKALARADAPIATVVDPIAVGALFADLQQRMEALEAGQAATEEALTDLLPDAPDLTAIEAELAALGEQYDALTARNNEIDARMAEIIQAQQALLDELLRLTAPSESAEAAATNAPAAAAAVADPFTTPRFGEELVLRLYGWVADLKRGIAGG